MAIAHQRASPTPVFYIYEVLMWLILGSLIFNHDDDRVDDDRK